MASSYGLPAGWAKDGSFITRKEFGSGPDPHEHVTRLRLRPDGVVEKSTWVEGLYGKGENYADVYELTPKESKRIKEILEARRAGRATPAMEKELFPLV